MKRREIARFHTVIYTRVTKVGYRDRRIYVLYVMGNDDSVNAVMPLVEFILEHGRRRSLAWQREVTRSTGLFIDFLRAYGEIFQAEQDRPQVFAAFAEALIGGSISADGSDPSGLFWSPKSLERATTIMNAMTSFDESKRCLGASTRKKENG